MKLKAIQFGLVGTGSILSFAFGGWDLLLMNLLLFMLIDYVTGMIKAGIRHEISPRVGFVGLAKKVGILAIVAVAHGLDQLFASTEANIFGIEFPVIRTMVIWGYLINEITSIMDNIKKLGVPLPPILIKVLALLKEENDLEVSDKFAKKTENEKGNIEADMEGTEETNLEATDGQNKDTKMEGTDGQNKETNLEGTDGQNKDTNLDVEDTDVTEHVKQGEIMEVVDEDKNIVVTVKISQEDTDQKM